MKRLALLLVALSWLVGCRCAEGTTPLGTGFGIVPESRRVDFGRVLEGATVRRTVTLFSETRAPVTVTLTTQAPFSSQRMVEIPGSTQLEVPVLFAAGNAAVEGVLFVSAGDKRERIVLVGEGVRPPQCLASSPCVTSMFVLDENRCVETAKPDDSACDPGNVCLEAGRCRAGACLGVARGCDDNNRCTTNACSVAEGGCVNPPIACPTPVNPCRRAACSPASGCGEENQPDLTPCGPLSCVQASICMAGQCLQIRPPDGTPCGPKVACIGESTCQQGTCVRPDAGPWPAEWSQRLTGTVSGPVIGFSGALYVPRCGLPLFDADGGLVSDAECGLSSFTPNGIERYTVVFDAGQSLLGVGPLGLVLAVDGGFALAARSTGVSFATEQRAHMSALAANNAGWVATVSRADDGGQRLLLWRRGDAGVELVEASVADVESLAWVNDALVLRSSTQIQFDGGRVTALDGGGPLSGSGALVASGETLFQVLLDGGVLATQPFGTDGGFDVSSGAETLVSDDFAVWVRRRCRLPLMSCLPEAEELVAAVTDVQGAVSWEVSLTPVVGVQLVAHSLVEGPVGSFAAVVQLSGDGGVDGGQAALQVFADGARRLICPLPAGLEVLQAHIADSTLYVVGSVGGVLRLQAFPLFALRQKQVGWVAEGGFGRLRSDGR